MDGIEQKLFRDLSADIDIPSEIDRVIKQALYKNHYKKNRLIRFNLKTIAATFIGLLLLTGVVFAGIITYEKIWKEPQKFTSIEEELATIPKEPTIEEKKEFITEEQAKKIALEVMDKLGYGEQTISKIELIRGYDNEYNCYYVVKTKEGYEEGLEVDINAYTGEFNFFANRDLKYKNIILDDITERKAKEIAKEIYLRFGFKEDEYEFESIEKQLEYFQSKELYKWQAKFNKKYDGIINPYEGTGMNFVVCNGEVIVESLGMSEDYTFENNPIVIKKEQAIEIVKEKNTKYDTNEISSINAKIAIRKMNTFIYQLENQDNVYKYKVDEISRKVWVVKVEYKNDIIRDIKRMEQYLDREYYIDATTGELIGGTYIM